MSRSAKEQAKSGLLLGVGLGAFLLALMLLDSGLRRIISLPPNGLVLSDWIAWLEVGGACALLFVTAQTWFWGVAGYALFAFGKSVVAILAGREWYATHRLLPRLELVEIAVFALTTIVLLFRFVHIRPSVLDRIALTFYVLAFSWYVHSPQSRFVALLPAAGLSGLIASWLVYRFKGSISAIGSDVNV